MRKSIDELVRPEQIQSWLAAAFSKVGITTLEILKDDQKVERAALVAYQSIPLFPVRVAIRATVGQVGFTAFVFRVRDEMLRAESVDLSRLTLGHLKSLWDPEPPKGNQYPQHSIRAASLGGRDGTFEAAAVLESSRGIAEQPSPVEPGSSKPPTSSGESERASEVPPERQFVAEQSSPAEPRSSEPSASSGRSERASIAAPQLRLGSLPCPSCRYENRSRARFCRACGVMLSKAPQAPPPASLPETAAPNPGSHSVAFPDNEQDSLSAPARPSVASPQVLAPKAQRTASQGGEATALSLGPQAAPLPVPLSRIEAGLGQNVPALTSKAPFKMPKELERTSSQVHPVGEIGGARTPTDSARNDSETISAAPWFAGSPAEPVEESLPAPTEAAEVQLDADRRSRPAIGTAETQFGAEQRSPPAIGTAETQFGADQRSPPAPGTSDIPCGTDQRSPAFPKHIGYWIAAILAGVIVGAVAAYFAMNELRNKSVPPNAAAPPHLTVPPTVAPPATTGVPETSAPPDATGAIGSPPEVAPPATSDSSAAPGGTLSSASLKSAKAVYASSCRSCHATGASGSPRLDDVEAWKPILARSRASLYASVLAGKGAMPPRGGDRSLQDDEVRRAVDFMVAAARAAAQAVVPNAPTVPPPSPQPAPVAPAAPLPVVPADGQPEWLRALRSEMERCRERNFLDRVLCAETARWKYCAPSRWNTVPECAVTKSETTSGNR